MANQKAQRMERDISGYVQKLNLLVPVRICAKDKLYPDADK